MIELVLALITLTGPDDQTITLVPSSIVSMRPPRGTDHLHASIKCMIHTVDGRIVTVIEDCDTVRERILGAD